MRIVFLCMPICFTYFPDNLAKPPFPRHDVVDETNNYRDYLNNVYIVVISIVNTILLMCHYVIEKYIARCESQGHKIKDIEHEYRQLFASSVRLVIPTKKHILRMM